MKMENWTSGKFVQVPCPFHDGCHGFPSGSFEAFIHWLKFHPLPGSLAAKAKERKAR